MSLPLAGIVVLDLSRAVAGPLCTMLLGDLGARVLKIEEAAGDEARSWGPPFAGADSTYFLGLNRNKESAVLDLKDPEDAAAARRMAARADMVVENFRPGVAARLGLGYEALREGHEGLIYGSVSGFGQEGEERDRPGYDLIVQAMSGVMHTSGAKVSFPVADVLAALFLQQGLLAALRRRERTGEGAYVDVSLLDSMLAAMSPLTAAALMAGVDPPPAGAAHANIVPYQLFYCREGKVAVGVTNERIWRRFCSAVGRGDWLLDERFASNILRNANRAALLAELEPLLLTRTAMEWETVLRAAEVPCAAVRTVGEALQLDAVRSVWTLDDGLAVFGNPVRMSDWEAPRRAVPKRGEHTAALRAEFA
ncbi:MAG TPA: CoA transferase [Bryobacteraceae bacterium]|nr:CoA transferase [Bryobacteraceae bacterium]